MLALREDERAALAAFMREAIAADRYPMAPSWRPGDRYFKMGVILEDLRGQGDPAK